MDRWVSSIVETHFPRAVWNAATETTKGTDSPPFAILLVVFSCEGKYPCPLRESPHCATRPSRGILSGSLPLPCLPAARKPCEVFGKSPPNGKHHPLPNANARDSRSAEPETRPSSRCHAELVEASLTSRGRRPCGTPGTSPPTHAPGKHPAPSTKHQAPSTKHQAPSTKHQAPSTKHQAPSTKHQAPSTKHQALSTKH
jgi:hypothetical protein